VSAQRIELKGFSMNDGTDRKAVQINRVHTFATLNEVGERLRATPSARLTPLPADLLRLVDRLDRVDRGEASRLNA
jgi:hypothetical protein